METPESTTGGKESGTACPHVNDESIAHYRRWQGQASIANREKKCDLRYRITVLGRVPVTVLLLGH